MVEVLIIPLDHIVPNGTPFFHINNERGETVEKDQNPILPGKYYVNAKDGFCVNNEPVLTRTISLGTGTRVQPFRTAIRARDSRCYISGVPANLGPMGAWWGFDVAHVFPLANEGHWRQNNYGRWITIPPREGGDINSVQNGILLRSDLHQLFDKFALIINPDDGYKVVFFTPDPYGNLAGSFIDQDLLSHPERPVDQVLRWHFRQAVLANMRGAGEPMLEHDFPPGVDMIQEIISSPRAAEVMEAHLFDRLSTEEFSAAPLSFGLC
ncbi:hypothetical protein Egran_06765 [Elaphomyces granulatus]|uniref:HNH nuclease domain-containing protein n=1 Tax=Elaphomyces granulatus TaxID=519963 RepID=A0A232LNS7_9EURO|nr:hypothetical protein Egran_06765 [Elaphomyces granulatus]